MNPNLVLHVGLQKTATTTLQRTVFAQHSEVFYLGKDRRSKAKKGCRSSDIYEILAPALWQQKRPFNADEMRARARQELDAAQGEAVPIASWESLGNGSMRSFDEMLRRLSLLFGHFRVLVCLRNPLTWTQSLYLQELEGHFRRRNRRHLGVNTYVEFEQWLEAKGGCATGSGGLFTYSNNIRRAVEYIGREHVGVFAFEELLANPTAYYTRICEFLGIDADEALRLAEDQRFNPTLSEAQLQLLRDTQSSLPRRLAWLLRTPRTRSKTLKRLADPSKGKARVALSGSTKARIEEVTRPGNGWLAKEFGLPLAEYGYAT